MLKFLYRSLLWIFLFGSLHAIEPYFSIDYLYWKFRQEQLYFAGTGANQSAANSITIQGQKFEFFSGFRAELGSNFPYENYDVALGWTRFRVNNTKEYSGAVVGNVIAIDLGGLTTGDVPKTLSAEAKWHLNFDMLDLEFGYTYPLNNRLTMRPLIGVKGGWVYQSQDVTYYDALVIPDDLETCTANLKNNFKGIGLKTGMGIDLDLGSQFGLFGRFNGALLYGNFGADLFLYVPSTVNITAITVDNSRNGIVPFLQMVIGVDWNYRLCQRWPIRIGLGYEIQYWWNMWRADNSLVNSFYVNYHGAGELVSQGLTLQTSFDF